MLEGLAVAARAKERLASIPGTSIPLVGLVASDVAGFTTPARELPAAQHHANAKGPAWQSFVRGRPTEVEFLNGEIIRMGKELSVPTPLNARAVELMQRITATGRHLSWQEVQHAFGMP